MVGNLALHRAEEPDNLRTTTGTVQVHTKRANDAVLAPGAKPIQEHEPAACQSQNSPGPWATVRRFCDFA